MKICVNCGAPVKDKEGKYVEEVFDPILHNKTGILKLMECRICTKVVDKYVEYEGCLVLLDLALQSHAAFRHLLVNQDNCKLVFKLVFITLIIEGFIKWNFYAKHGNGHLFLEQEFEFYTQITVSLLCLLAFIFNSLFIFLGNQAVQQWRCIQMSGNIFNLIIGLLTAYCFRSLNLMPLLWETNSNGFLWIFVDLLFFMSTYSAMKVFSGLNKWQCLTTSLCSHATFVIVQLYARQV